MLVKASAPGSLMLLGEHAVLQGHPALVCALDKRMTVILKPRLDKQIHIESILGSFTVSLSAIKIEKPFEFVLAALLLYQKKMPQGCDIQIESEFSHEIGLGSSAAITVAMLAALRKWLGMSLEPEKLVRQAREVILSVQGLGSGADAAASVYGGIVSYTLNPLKIKTYSVLCPLTILYCGFKTTTKEVLLKVKKHFDSMPVLFKRICESIGQCSLAGRLAIEKQDWQSLGSIMNCQQGLMEALAVSLPLLQTMTEDLRKQQGIVGAKISGSGLGDCVIGLGWEMQNYHNENAPQVKQIQASMTLQGVQCEKI